MHFIDIFMDKKLMEQENNLDSMICASILQELIFSVEDATIINDTKHEVAQLDTNLNDSFLNCIDSGIDCEELEDNWCNIFINSINDDYIYPMELKQKDFKQLLLLSKAINEIRYKNDLIKIIRDKYFQCKKQIYLLHDQFTEQALKLIHYFQDIINSIDNKSSMDLPAILQKIITDISQDIKVIFQSNDHSISINNNNNSIANDLSLFTFKS